MRQAERALQAECMIRLSSGVWPVIAIPVPNGIYLPAKTAAERALVAKVINTMKRNGMLLPGAPDLVIIWAGGGALVELKRPRSRDLMGHTSQAGRLSEAQFEVADRARALGVHYACVDSWPALEALLRCWLAETPQKITA